MIKRIYALKCCFEINIVTWDWFTNRVEKNSGVSFYDWWCDFICFFNV